MSEKDDFRKAPRNERILLLSDVLAKCGYKIKELKFLVDANEQDEETASQTGIPFLKLTLSL